MPDGFQLVTDYKMNLDQANAVSELTAGIINEKTFQTLLGVTGSGKTFTLANVIEKMNVPTLIISHNKTLAAQLYGEFKHFFPHNAVEYFISYYDYYQPEAYIPSSDVYIEKDTSINDEIDRLRLRATSSLLSRKDVIIVASVSCIYGLGSPQDFQNLHLFLETGLNIKREQILERLIDIHYARNDFDFQRGTFRVRGDIVEVFPAYDDRAVRVEMWGDEIEKISAINTVTGETIENLEKIAIYPAKHFVTTIPKLEAAVEAIQKELHNRLNDFRASQKLLEAQRLETRTMYDIEMLQEVGYCSGIENYSRHISGRAPGERPACLIDYFPRNFLMILDESHATIPQIRAMYNGDRARKETLVEYGFRLPSALDNRPLKFDEFENIVHQLIFMSATPGDYELEKCGGEVVEQIIRPTGLMDPEVIIRPVKGQIDNLLDEIRKRSAKSERTLVTTLTKRMAEDLTEYLGAAGVRARYLHSEIHAIDRVDILRELRLGKFDVLVGINLLREGLDLPEVSLVAILDADKEGFLRSTRSLIQTAGRAARNVNGLVILYADKETESIKNLVNETKRRKLIQKAYNEQHGIEPKTIYKSAEEVMSLTSIADSKTELAAAEKDYSRLSGIEREDIIEQLKLEMRRFAEKLDFERAAEIRDEIEHIKGFGKKTSFKYGRR